MHIPHAPDNDIDKYFIKLIYPGTPKFHLALHIVQHLFRHFLIELLQHWPPMSSQGSALQTNTNCLNYTHSSFNIYEFLVSDKDDKLYSIS